MGFDECPWFLYRAALECARWCGNTGQQDSGTPNCIPLRRGLLQSSVFAIVARWSVSCRGFPALQTSLSMRNLIAARWRKSLRSRSLVSRRRCGWRMSHRNSKPVPARTSSKRTTRKISRHVMLLHCKALRDRSKADSMCQIWTRWPHRAAHQHTVGNEWRARSNKVRTHFQTQGGRFPFGKWRARQGSNL